MRHSPSLTATRRRSPVARAIHRQLRYIKAIANQWTNTPPVDLVEATTKRLLLRIVGRREPARITQKLRSTRRIDAQPEAIGATIMIDHCETHSSHAESRMTERCALLTVADCGADAPKLFERIAGRRTENARSAGTDYHMTSYCIPHVRVAVLARGALVQRTPLRSTRYTPRIGGLPDSGLSRQAGRAYLVEKPMNGAAFSSS